MRVQRVRIASPTSISTGPIRCMKVSARIGNTRAARGLKYIPQVVSRLKYLSNPARKAASPRLSKTYPERPPRRIDLAHEWHKFSPSRNYRAPRRRSVAQKSLGTFDGLETL